MENIATCLHRSHNLPLNLQIGILLEHVSSVSFIYLVFDFCRECSLTRQPRCVFPGGVMRACRRRLIYHFCSLPQHYGVSNLNDRHNTFWLIKP